MAQAMLFAAAMAPAPTPPMPAGRSGAPVRTHAAFTTRRVLLKRALQHCASPAGRAACRAAAAAVQPEAAIEGLAEFLDGLKWDKNGLVVAIAQHVDTGEVLMQAFADRAAVCETLQTGLATFYSRSRGGRWCKGETSGHFIRVLSTFMDCDRDSFIYLSEPIGPACHTNAPTCYFQEMAVRGGGLTSAGEHTSAAHTPATTLYALERTIAARRAEAEAGLAPGGKPSWTARLIADPALLCKKVREEAGELCQTWEESEGKERAASEAADLLYHAMVLMNVQGVSLEEVSKVLRSRFGTSGVEEKASRPPKPQ